MSITEEVAAHVAGARSHDLPENVRHETRRIILNTVGCMAGGASHEMVGILLRSLGPRAAAGSTTVVGRSESVDASTAALINGVSSSVYAFDDAHEDAIIHPGGPVVSAALALAQERGADGDATLVAIALGVEFSCRLGRLLTREGGSESLGWSLTGIVGGIGAAIAAAKLMGMDTAGTQTAIGIAASQACGIRVTHGTMATAMLTGNGAQVGLRSAFLAEAGMSGPKDVFEHRFGYVAQFAPGTDPALLTKDLGVDHALLSIVYKLYPCGIVAYPAVDAALVLRRDLGSDLAAVQSIEVAVGRTAYQLCNRPAPADLFELQLSLQYWTAVALARGEVSLADASVHSLAQPDLEALRRRINVSLDENLPADTACITVQLENGVVMSRQAQGLRGGPRLPLSDDELTQKFMGQASGSLTGGKPADAVRLLWNFDRLDGLGGLAAALQG